MAKKLIRLYEQDTTDFSNNGLKILNPTSAKITRNLIEYTYQLELTHLLDEKGMMLTEERILGYNGQYFRISSIRRNLKEVSVIAKHIFFDLNKNFIEDINIKNKTGSMALAHILGGTSYPHSFSATSDIDTVASSRLVRKNVVSALIGDTDNSFINRWGGELDIDGFTFKLNEQIGKDDGYTIQYGKNLTGLDLQLNMLEVVTRIRPVGFDGIEIDGLYVDSPYIDNYALPIIKEIKYENVKWKGSPNYEEREDDDSYIYDNLAEAQAKLIELATNEFVVNEIDLPKTTINIEFIELSKTEEYKHLKFLQNINIGDIVHVYHKPLNINLKSRCIEYVYDCILNKYETITLGSYTKNFFSQTQTTNNKVDNGNLDIEFSGMINDILQKTEQHLTDTITQAMGGYVYKTNNALYIMDTDDISTAQKIWVWNKNGLAYSSTGVGGPYTTGITMDGYIVGSMISANSIVGEQIQANSIKTANLELSVQKKIESATSEETVKALIKADLDGFQVEMNETLNTTIENYYTKSETDSAINVAKDAIHLSVSQTYETKTEVENKLNDAQAIAKAMQDGKVLYPDVTFKESSNGLWVYNNAFNDAVVIERIPKPSDCPTTSTHCIKIKHTGIAGPVHGGFCQIINSRPNAIFIQKFIAKLPIGRTLMLAHNPLGDDATDRWLTSSIGTGNWEEYIRETRCGSTGTFSTGGHVYVSGGDTPSNSNPLEWYLASCTVVDITDVDDRVSILTGRINEAEQKITAEAITNTVKEHFYTKEETDSQITSQGYQTASEVQQTVDNLQIKFTQSGGYNFVRNGNAKNDQAYWNAYYLPEASWGIRNDSWTAYEYAFEINATNSTTSVNAIYQIVDGLITGETYTFSALVAGHRGSNRIIIANGEGTAEIGWSDEATDYYGGMYYDNWKRISGTFKATSDSCQLRLCHYNGWGNSYGWFKQIQINRGSIPLPYSPHPSEIYDGITTIDRDGIDVATSYGAHTQFHSGGMSSYNNSNQRTLGIENGGISFHAWNNNALAAYITQSSLWGGSQSANGLAISTTANGTYLALGTSSLSDVNTTLNMDQALTISASDSFQPRGINLWKDVHAHGYGIRQLSHLKLAGSSPIQFDYLDHSPSTIYEAVDSGHSLYVMGGYQMHLGVMEGSGTPHGVIWMRGKTDTHSYTHWDFHNYTMYNMKTASTYANYNTRRIGESYGVTSNVDGVRYVYRDVELVNGRAIRSIPLEYKGCEYDIVSIVCKGRGNAWVQDEDVDKFVIEGDCQSVNIEIIIHEIEQNLHTVALDEAYVEPLSQKIEPEIPTVITNMSPDTL